MDFKQLRYFMAIVQEGKISAAAAALPLAQPALTRQLQLLEESVGAQLLSRSRQGVTLTAAGAAFHRDAKHLLSQFEQAKHNARRVADGQTGQLRLGVPIMHLWVPRITGLLNDFRQQYPDITLKVVSLLSGPQVEALRQDKLDAGMLFFPPEDDASLCSHQLYEDRLVLVARAGSRLATHPPRRLAELNGEDFVWFNRNSTPTYHDRLIHAFQRAGFTPTVAQETTDNAAMLCLVAAGMGCTVLPEMTLAGAPSGVSGTGWTTSI
jgi:DNA-binding transcriptional LysR family regulator